MPMSIHMAIYIYKTEIFILGDYYIEVRFLIHKSVYLKRLRNDQSILQSILWNLALSPALVLPLHYLLQQVCGNTQLS